MNKDITYCMSTCGETDCERHFSKVNGDPFEHSFGFLLGTKYCIRDQKGEHWDGGGVYIRDIPIPPTCGLCVFSDKFYHNYEVESAICIISCRDVDANKKSDECPLIRVEPHGRLIDADKLIEELTPDPVEKMGCPEPDFLRDMITVLDTCPVVLE